MHGRVNGKQTKVISNYDRSLYVFLCLAYYFAREVCASAYSRPFLQQNRKVSTFTTIQHQKKKRRERESFRPSICICVGIGGMCFLENCALLLCKWSHWRCLSWWVNKATKWICFAFLTASGLFVDNIENFTFKWNACRGSSAMSRAPTSLLTFTYIYLSIRMGLGRKVHHSTISDTFLKIIFLLNNIIF